MRSRSEKKHTIDLLFPLALLLVFTASAVLVLLLAADIYKDTAENSVRGRDADTAAAYISEKIHQSDVQDSAELTELSGCTALELTHREQGETYCTYIYYYDGALRELMVKEGKEAAPDWGREILPLNDFKARQLRDGLFFFSFTDGAGNSAETYAALRSKGE